MWFVKRHLAVVSQALWDRELDDERPGDLAVFRDALVDRKLSVQEAVRDLLKDGGESAAAFLQFPESVYAFDERAERRELKILSLGYCIYRVREGVVKILDASPSVAEVAGYEEETDVYGREASDLIRTVVGLEESLMQSYPYSGEMRSEIRSRRPYADHEQGSLSEFRGYLRMHCQDLLGLAARIPDVSCAIPPSRFSPRMWRSFSAKEGDRYLLLPRQHGFSIGELEYFHEQSLEDPDLYCREIMKRIIGGVRTRIDTVGSAVMVVDVQRKTAEHSRRRHLLTPENDFIERLPSW